MRRSGPTTATSTARSTRAARSSAAGPLDRRRAVPDLPARPHRDRLGRDEIHAARPGPGRAVRRGTRPAPGPRPRRAGPAAAALRREGRTGHAGRADPARRDRRGADLRAGRLRMRRSIPARSGHAIAPWGKLMVRQPAGRRAGMDERGRGHRASGRPPSVPRSGRRGRPRWPGSSRAGSACYTATFPLLLMPAVSSGGSAHSRYQAELGATAILLAAERHRRKTGAWPQSIAAIDRASCRARRSTRSRAGLSDGAPRRPPLHLLDRPEPQGRARRVRPKKWTTGGPDDVGAIGWDVDRRRQPAAREQPRPPRAGNRRGRPSKVPADEGYNGTAMILSS